jgi:hypothetical protein
MMARDPSERFQTPAAVAEALRPFGRPRAADEPPNVGAKGPTPPPHSNAPPEADPLDIPISIQPAATLPARPSTTRRQGTVRVKKHHYRQAVSFGALALLVIGGILFKPALKQLLLPAEPDSNWTDLISGTDPSTNAIRGQWEKRGSELSVSAEEFAWLVLPFDVPEEYDFEVTFTRTSGMHSIALFFVAGGGQATYEVDAWGQHMAGVQNIAGRTLEDPSVPSGSLTLENGRRHTARIEVRRRRVATYLDGELVVTYQGNGSDLSILEDWEPRGRVLGVGAFLSDTIFHSIRVRER